MVVSICEDVSICGGDCRCGWICMYVPVCVYRCTWTQGGQRNSKKGPVGDPREKKTDRHDQAVLSWGLVQEGFRAAAQADSGKSTGRRGGGSGNRGHTQLMRSVWREGMKRGEVEAVRAIGCLPMKWTGADGQKLAETRSWSQIFGIQNTYGMYNLRQKEWPYVWDAYNFQGVMQNNVWVWFKSVCGG